MKATKERRAKLTKVATYLAGGVSTSIQLLYKNAYKHFSAGERAISAVPEDPTYLLSTKFTTQSLTALAWDADDAYQQPDWPHIDPSQTPWADIPNCLVAENVLKVPAAGGKIEKRSRDRLGLDRSDDRAPRRSWLGDACAYILSQGGAVTPGKKSYVNRTIFDYKTNPSSYSDLSAVAFVAFAIHHFRSGRGGKSRRPTIAGKVARDSHEQKIDHNDIFTRIAATKTFPLLRPLLGLTLQVDFEIPKCWSDALNTGTSIELDCALDRSALLLDPAAPRYNYVCHPTSAILTSSAFYAKPGSAVELSSDRHFVNRQAFSLETLNHEGAAFKLINRARTVDRTLGARLLIMSQPADLSSGAGNRITVRDPLKDMDRQTSAGEAAISWGSPLAITQLGKYFAVRSFESLKKNRLEVRNRTISSYDESWAKFAELCDRPLIGWNSYTMEFADPVPTNPTPIKWIAHPIRDIKGNILAIDWQLFGNKNYPKLPEPDLPNLRSGGIRVIMPDFPMKVKRSLERQAELANGQPTATPFGLEELILGYIPEIGMRHPSNFHLVEWIPLTLRKERYGRVDPERTHGTSVETDSDAISAIEQLTAIRAGLFAPAGGRTLDGPDDEKTNSEQDVHVSPVFLRLTEWGFGAPRPRRSDSKNHGWIIQDLQAIDLQRNQLLPVPKVAEWALPVAICADEKSVPTIRFVSFRSSERSVGKYLFRCRAMDYAGNTASVTEQNSSYRTIEFRRFEAVAPPEILRLADEPLHGQLKISTTTMIVRGGHQTDIRWLVPPRISNEIARRHGMFSDPEREYEDNISFKAIRLERNGAFPLWPKNGSPSEQFPVFLPSAGDPEVPYYPDPLCRGVAWRLEYLVPNAGAAAISTKCIRWVEQNHSPATFYNLPDGIRDWPDARPIQLILSESAEFEINCFWSSNIAHPEGFPSSESAGFVIKVGVPRGLSAKLYLSSLLSDEKINSTSDANYVETMALGAKGSKGDGDYCILENSNDVLSAAHGFNRYLSPEIVLNLTNAWEKPGDKMNTLGADITPEIWEVRNHDDDRPIWSDYPGHEIRSVGVPEFRRPVVPIGVNTRQLQAIVSLGGSCHAPSTGKIKYLAAFSYPVLTPVSGKSSSSDFNPYSWVRQSSQIGEFQVDEGISGYECLLPSQRLIETFASPGYRLVEYSLTACSRYIKHFGDKIHLTSKDFEMDGGVRRVAMLNVTPPSYYKYKYVKPTFRWIAGGQDEEVVQSFRRFDGRWKKHPNDYSPHPTFCSGRLSAHRIYLEIDVLDSGADTVVGMALSPIDSIPADSGSAKNFKDDCRKFGTSWGTDPTRFTKGISLGPKGEDLFGYRVFLANEIVDVSAFARDLLRKGDSDEKPRTRVIRYLNNHFSEDLIESLKTLLPNDEAGLQKCRESIAAELDLLLRDDSKSGFWVSFGEKSDAVPMTPIQRAGWSRQYLANAFAETDYFLANHLFDEKTNDFKSFQLQDSQSVGTSENKFRIVPFLPQYEFKTGLWYIDVQCSTPSEYAFIQYSLVTYQPHSVDNCHVSSIQKVDMAQILPNRWLSICRGETEKTLLVTISNIDTRYSDHQPDLPENIAFKITVFRTDETSGAMPDRDITGIDQTIKVSTKDGSGTLSYQWKLTWPSYSTGARRLFIQEVPVPLAGKTDPRFVNPIADDPDTGSCYFDIIEL